MKNLLDRINNLLKNGISDDSDRELLANSLFYYCCGKDATPIIAFGSDYQLYVYADCLLYGEYGSETRMLYDRLSKAGYNFVEKMKLTHWKKAENVEMTLWRTTQNRYFSLVYIQHDAKKTFKNIYSDCDGKHDGKFKNNYIQPKCICNYRYEFYEEGNQNSYSFFSLIEKRTEYILGHCFHDKYKCIAEFDYYGDYGQAGSKIQLYHRMYWYVY